MFDYDLEILRVYPIEKTPMGLVSSRKPRERTDLVGRFNPFEKYARQNGFIFPKFRGKNKKYLKPPPRQQQSITCHENRTCPRVHHLYFPVSTQ